MNTHRMKTPTLLLIAGCLSFALGPAACGDDDDGQHDAAPDASLSDGGVDAGEPDAEVIPPPYCEALGLPERPFVTATDATELYALAADVTIPTEDDAGDFVLSERWTGCDSYLFIQDRPEQNVGWPTGIWARDADAFLERLPRNVHVFFTSTYSLPGSIQASLDEIKGQLADALANLPEEDRTWWEEHIHYVPVSASTLDGFVGTLMSDPGWGVGIDRLQRVRFIGSYADLSRFDQNRQWFEPNLSMAANEAIYYNFEAEREARLEASNATVIPVFDATQLADPGWAGTRGHADVTLPDAATMAGFDTLELDLHLGCVGWREYGDCPAWDYLVYLYLCDEADPTTCDVEIGRWITTYHRDGRWVHDVSALLPLLDTGGTRRFAFYTQQRYVVSLDLRLSNQAKEYRPASLHFLYSGGTFNATYNDGYQPVVVPIPAGDVRVELATVITGHGGADPGNCAEFCNTTHHFTVNGTENILDFLPEVAIQTSCMDQANQGTVPNQYGTWWYGRSGWCPGKEVPLVMTDVTAQVTPGSDATFDYEGYYNNAPYPSGGASIRLKSWVLISRRP